MWHVTRPDPGFQRVAQSGQTKANHTTPHPHPHLQHPIHPHLSPCFSSLLASTKRLLIPHERTQLAQTPLYPLLRSNAPTPAPVYTSFQYGTPPSSSLHALPPCAPQTSPQHELT